MEPLTTLRRCTSFAADDPTPTWTAMKARVAAGDLPGALSYFSVVSKDDYRRALLFDPAAASVISGIGSLTPAFVRDDAAEFFFTDTVAGQVITFPVEFIKENGTWKILEF